jgi:uncharacterized repeat protein (TIGR01451 family)
MLILGILAIALGIGMALVSPAAGATLSQPGGGSIIGTVTLNGAPAPGVTAELRQRSNEGVETTLASVISDASGTYRFIGQPSAPNDAFYYVRLTGGKGMLAVWNTFPIIYVHGSDFSVPAVEMADVAITGAVKDSVLQPNGSLTWNARRSGEIYRVFIYAKGKADKPALDSGSLGTATQFTVVDGALPEGDYEAIVQVRDAVVGYGQSQSRLSFAIGKAVTQPSSPQNPPAQPEQTAPTEANPAPASIDATVAPASPGEANTEAEPASGSDAQDKQQEKESGPDLQVKLSANKTSVGQGESMIYTIKVTNAGKSTAEGVVVTDRLPEGVVIDAYRAKSTSGSLSVDGNTVTAQVGNLGPNSEAVIEIPVSVSATTAGSLSNQASARYQGASDPVQSNAYIAQVAEPLTGSNPAPPKTEAQPASPAQQPGKDQLAPPADSSAKAPAVNPPASQQQAQPQKQPQTQAQANPPAPQAKTNQPGAKQPVATIPQTGGSFPVVLAVALAFVTLLARYLRGQRQRRV